MTDTKKEDRIERANLQDLLKNGAKKKDTKAQKQAPGTDSEAEPPVYRYCIAGILPPELEKRINAARQSVKIDLAKTGSFDMAGVFRSSEIEAVKSAVKTWVHTHLPLELALKDVEARVIGKQRYRTAWFLQPPEKLVSIQQELQKALQAHIQPESEFSFSASLKICDPTPVQAFPALVRELQQQFAPYRWHFNAVEILQVDEKDLEERWEVLETFRAIQVSGPRHEKN